MREIGVPQSAIRTDAELGRFRPGDSDSYWANRLLAPGYAARPAGLKVVVLPLERVFRFSGTADSVRGGNVVFVASAGNTERRAGTSEPARERRDIYRRDDGVWQDEDDTLAAPRHTSYDETIATLRTGKAILATWADVDADGTIVPHADSVKCGDAMDFCFAAVLPFHERGGSGRGTSFAAPVVGAHAYYFFQLWDRAGTVVDMMKSCAIDVGPNGPDREFGVGVVNADCPEVAGREVRTASASLRVAMRSPLADTLHRGAPRPPGASAPVPGFAPDGGEGGLLPVPRMYLSERYRALGASVPFAGGEMTGVWGYGTAPLGVSSTLAPATESPFFEVGFERDVLRFGDEDDGSGGALALAGSWGVADDEIGASAARLGLLYESERGGSSLSLYVGAWRAAAEVGIPGRQEVGRNRVAVERSGAEVFARAGLRF